MARFELRIFRFGSDCATATAIRLIDFKQALRDRATNPNPQLRHGGRPHHHHRHHHRQLDIVHAGRCASLRLKDDEWCEHK